jgi:hypothetical protein
MIRLGGVFDYSKCFIELAPLRKAEANRHFAAKAGFGLA